MRPARSSSARPPRSGRWCERRASGSSWRPRPAATTTVRSTRSVRSACCSRGTLLGGDRPGRRARRRPCSAPSRPTTPRSASCTHPAFIDATRRAGHGEDGDWRRFGYGPGDNPIFTDMHEAGRARVRRHGRGRARGRRGPRRSTPSTPPAASITRWPAAPPGSACTTIPPSASRGCSATAWSGSRTSTSTCTTATACRRSFAADPRVLTVSIHEYAPEVGFFPGHRVGVRARVGRRRGLGAERPVARPAPATRRGWPRSEAPSCRLVARLRARRTRDAARMRHAPHGPARAPAAHHARLPRGRGRAARGSRTSLPPAGGWRPAAAATSGRASCRARGRRTSPRWRARPCPTSCRPHGWSGPRRWPAARCRRR